MKFKLSAINEKWLVFILLFIYLIFAAIWHFLSDAAWDDDCISRFYNTQEAFKNPSQFISLWNRPLFVILFALPFQLSKHMVLLMAVFSAIGAYFLYKSAKKLELDYAFLVIPLLLFQAFFFNISKSSLAEPLAAVIISAGLFFYLDKKFLHFAILGSLLPLARLELSVALVLWVYILYINKKTKYIYILVIPTILWNFAGTLINGDIFWLLTALKSSNPDQNPYGHTDFWHYLLRYIYVLGPAVFYFFFIGFFEKLIKRKIDIFIMIQFILVFLLYVLFSWKLNLGKSSGFLRNMMPLAPLAAIIALYGFNSWIKSINQPIDRLIKGKSFFADKDKIRIISISIVCLLLTYLFFSQKLIMHHIISATKDYKNFYVISFFTMIYLISVIIYARLDVIKYLKQIIPFILIIIIAGFTLITERPDVHDNSEREAISKVSDIYINSILKDYPTYVNHSYFFWANDIKRTKNFNTVTKESLDEAPNGSIIIFENHYNQLQNRGISLEYLEENKQFIQLFRVVSSNKTFYCVVILKVGNDKPSKTIKIFNNLISNKIEIPSLYYYRANFLAKYKKYNLAEKDYMKALKLDSSFYEAYFRMGIILFEQNKISDALKYFQESIRFNPKYIEAYSNKGVCYAITNDYVNAEKNFTVAIQLDNDFYDAYYYRALVYSNSSRFKEAIADYSKTIELQPENAENYVNRANAYLKLGDKKKGCDDLKIAFKLDKSSIPENLRKYCN